jgi:hypothetical protein
MNQYYDNRGEMLLESIRSGFFQVVDRRNRLSHHEGFIAIPLVTAVIVDGGSEAPGSPWQNVEVSCLSDIVVRK